VLFVGEFDDFLGLVGDFGKGGGGEHGARLRLREGLVKAWPVATCQFLNLIL
jgi:hypothetical protein